MAVHGTSFVRAEKHVKGITAILTSTACEWFLIFLLLIDAVFSFLVTKFAHYCELQIPCILCSRLDHVLGNEKPESYRNSLCSSHRSEISSLISCHIHGKLAAAHGMCDDCLLSFSTETNSNPDVHRLFVGKLRFDPGSCGPQSLLPNGDFTPTSMSSKWCSCCNKPWKSRQNVERLLQQKSPTTWVSKSNIPLPHRLNNREGTKKIRVKSSGSAVTPQCFGKSGSDTLSHVRYSELKITSDSESEFRFSDDDDDGSNVVCVINEAKDDVRKPRDTKGLTPDVSSWHGLFELNWQQPNQKICSPLPELILLDDISSPSNTPGLPGGVSPISHGLNPSATTEPASLVDMSPSFDCLEAPVGASTENSNVTGTTDIAPATINRHEEMFKLLNETAEGFKDDPVQDSPAPVDPTYEDSSDVSKLALCGEGGDTSGLVAEQPLEKEVDRVRDALNLSPEQNSSAQGNHLSENNKSNNVQGCGNELQGSNDATSNGIQTPHKSVTVERTESAGLESLDGSTVSEIEGESTIDRLNRQVEYDRRCMNALYKELDEERSAAAVAANEAMAMITRLQEEKSALHMDALQYLRMMEEQAEYDMEELEKANDLMAEKEKQIQDLEEELEYYRLKYPHESVMDITSEENSKKENVYVENMSLEHIKDDANVRSDSTYSKVSKGIDKPDVLIASLSEFTDEKLYILQSLESLEKKLQTFAHDVIVHDMSNGGCTEEAADRMHNQGEVSVKEGSSVNCHVEDNGYPLRKDSVSNGSLPSQEGLNASVGVDQVVSKENNLVSNGKKEFTHYKNINLVSLENEISDLNERLEALEEDYNFLEHAFDLLQNGNEGLLFVQEIARQLQEIRKIGIKSRCPSVS